METCITSFTVDSIFYKFINGISKGNLFFIFKFFLFFSEVVIHKNYLVSKEQAFLLKVYP